MTHGNARLWSRVSGVILFRGHPTRLFSYQQWRKKTERLVAAALFGVWRKKTERLCSFARFVLLLFFGFCRRRFRWCLFGGGFCFRFGRGFFSGFFRCFFTAFATCFCGFGFGCGFFAGGFFFASAFVTAAFFRFGCRCGFWFLGGFRGFFAFCFRFGSFFALLFGLFAFAASFLVFVYFLGLPFFLFCHCIWCFVIACHDSFLSLNNVCEGTLKPMSSHFPRHLKMPPESSGSPFLDLHLSV
jgi:hypothetical protein